MSKIESLQEIYHRLFGADRVPGKNPFWYKDAPNPGGEYPLPASDKGGPHNYIVKYEQLFEPIRHEPVNILEIGVALGGSLALWAEYFPNHKKIVGMDSGTESYLHIPMIEKVYVDLNSLPSQGFYEKIRRALEKYPNVEYKVVPSAYSNESVNLLKTELQGELFDVIIDDASHVAADCEWAVSNYRNLLRPGGLFIVEDCIFNYSQFSQEFDSKEYHEYGPYGDFFVVLTKKTES